MPGNYTAASHNKGLTLKVYRGDRAILIAFNLEEQQTPNLAGFAIKVTDPDGKSEFLKNRLSFTSPITSETTMPQRENIRTPSNEAPFQKFRWVWFPPVVRPGSYTIEATAMYHSNASDPLKLTEGTSTSVPIEIEPVHPDFPHFELGFTSGYLSAQFYAQRFENKAIQPTNPTFDFDTTSFQEQYEFLGGHAREMIFRLLDETLADPSLTLDVFAYDFDEPDIIRTLGKLGNRLRIILDNSKDHAKQGAPELDALAEMRRLAGEANVVIGHFKRFAHKKIFIQKQNGTPIKVLTGSTNFSVRGLYVQANNVMLFTDSTVARLYADVFDAVFKNMKGFSGTPLAQKWFDLQAPSLPSFSVSFAPHQNADISLKKVADAIQGAQSSVLFAVMNIGGGGAVLKQLRTLRDRKDLFFYGVVQSGNGDLSVHKPGASRGSVVDFEFLKSKVPGPFQSEYSGGKGQVIHHKFVVIDFNDTSPQATPCVFAGSSNLASGGETSNGDNLLIFTDPAIVTTYTIEAVRLFDHYQFRDAWNRSTKKKPLELSKDRETPWWSDYYNPQKMKFHDRVLFSK